jgi:hypothetical protein
MLPISIHRTPHQSPRVLGFRRQGFHILRLTTAYDGLSQPVPSLGFQLRSQEAVHCISLIEHTHVVYNIVSHEITVLLGG